MLNPPVCQQTFRDRIAARTTVAIDHDLLEQAFIHDEKGKSVAQAVKEAEGKIGAPVKIAGFVRYALGEGIEKQESDFAAEVAAASGQKKPPGDAATVS